MALGELNHRRTKAVVPFWFVVPAGLLFAFAVLVPDIQAVVYSFTNWNGLSGTFNFSGLDNYIAAFQNDHFVSGLIHTVLLTVMITLAQLFFGLLLAVALTSRVRSQTALRALFFAPVVMTSVAVGYVWKFIYAPTGVLNELLSAVGLGGLNRDWLGDPSINLASIALICVWQSVGVTMAIYIAGLESIDSELLEASSIDGANAFQRFWYIRRPLLAAATLINVVLCTVGSLRVFDQIFITTQGGPARSTSTLATMTYTDGFVPGNYSYGITLSVILAVFVGAVAIVQFRVVKGDAS